MKNKSKEHKNEEEKIKRDEVHFLQSWYFTIKFILIILLVFVTSNCYNMEWYRSPDSYNH